MIGGFEEPTSGQILLADRDVVGLPPYKRDVNTVFQSYALFPHMTIAENVAFGLERRKLRRARSARVSARCSSSSTSRDARRQADAAVRRPAAARRARAGDRQQPARSCSTSRSGRST